MAAAATAVEELVREYLLYRGFMQTLRTFEQERKEDKDKGLKVNTYICILGACLEHEPGKCVAFTLPGLQRRNNNSCKLNVELVCLVLHAFVVSVLVGQPNCGLYSRLYQQVRPWSSGKLSQSPLPSFLFSSWA